MAKPFAELRSRMTTKQRREAGKKVSAIIPTHPGEVLRTEFMEPKGLTQDVLAGKLGIPVVYLNSLLRGKRRVTAELAVLLSKTFRTSARFWMDLQRARDMWTVERTLGKFTFKVFWSKEDGEYIGTCSEYPSLSHLAQTRVGAMTGITDLVKWIEIDILR